MLYTGALCDSVHSVIERNYQLAWTRQLSSPVYTIQPVVNRLSNGFDSRLNVCIHDTTGLTTGCIVHTNIQPVVKPVWQPVWQPAVSCIQPVVNSRLSNRLSNRLYNPVWQPCWTNSGCSFNTVVKPVIKPVAQPVVSCKRGISEVNWCCDHRTLL